MVKNENKTKPTDVDPQAYLETLENTKRYEEGMTLLGFFNRVTQLKPQMWGESLIGYGRYHYRYKSGREGDFFLTGFSPRKTALTIYIMPGYQGLSEPLGRLGKHKLGKSCLYINKLADVDMDVLEELVLYGLAYMRETYETFDR